MRFNLINNINHPYQKPNSKTVHINKHLNHPPNILKELLKSINKLILDISCNQDIFDAAKATYEEALHNNSLKEELKYKNKYSEEQTRHEERGK